MEAGHPPNEGVKCGGLEEGCSSKEPIIIGSLVPVPQFMGRN